MGTKRRMPWRIVAVCAAFVGLAGVAFSTATAKPKEPGFMTTKAGDARAGRSRRRGEAAADRRRHGRWLHVRIDSGRDRDRRARTITQVDVYVNHETSLVPFAADGEATSRTRLLSKLTLNEKTGGTLAGSFAIPNSAELPALLLELPRLAGARLRPRPRPHRRGGTRLGEPDRRCGARDAVRARRRAGRRRRRLRRRVGRVPVDLRHGPAQPRERASRCRGYRQAGDPLGRRHVRRAGVAALPLHGEGRRRGLERPGTAVRVRLGQTSAVNDYGDIHSGESISRPLHRGAADDRDRQEARRAREVTGLRLRLPGTAGRRPRRAAVGARDTGATSRTRSSSSGSRTSPTTGTTRTSSTSPTPASRGRSRTRRHRQADARPVRAPPGPVSERSDLQARARQAGPARGREPLDPAERELRPRWLQQPERHAPAGQRRDDEERAADHRGSGWAQPGRDRRPRVWRYNLEVRPEAGARRRAAASTTAPTRRPRSRRSATGSRAGSSTPRTRSGRTCSWSTCRRTAGRSRRRIRARPNYARENGQLLLVKIPGT